jgi:methionyl-tRNA synthetase
MAYYATTSIPYVNAAPHLGHALEYVQADALARFRRLIGDDTYFLTGTDDNSLKNVLAAEREGLPTAALVERNARTFRDLAAALNVSHDGFIRTSIDPRHASGVRKLWEACRQHGDIYTKLYRGLYCVGCEQFYTPDELIDGLCPEHLTPPEVVEEENYFFRLSRYGERLLALIDLGELRILPESRRNEVRSFVAAGLADISISRSAARARGWGIPVPGDPSQVVYVWFDALTNYITALGYAENAELYRRYWLANPNRTHLIGKGIVRFHAVYWPAMLLSAGEPLPTTLWVHGYLTVDGQKISKSLGNAVDPLGLVQRYGVDPVRYWLLREVPPFGDTDYTQDKLERRYYADLANDLGNLLNRTVSMLHRYRGGVIPLVGELAPADRRLVDLAAGLPERIRASVERDLDPQAALVVIWELVGAANRYVEESVPWTLARVERAADPAATDRLDAVLANLAEACRIIAEALRPFLPATAERIAAGLGTSLGDDWLVGLTWGQTLNGRTVARPQPIFPRLLE